MSDCRQLKYDFGRGPETTFLSFSLGATCVTINILLLNCFAFTLNLRFLDGIPS